MKMKIKVPQRQHARTGLQLLLTTRINLMASPSALDDIVDAVLAECSKRNIDADRVLAAYLVRSVSYCGFVVFYSRAHAFTIHTVNLTF